MMAARMGMGRRPNSAGRPSSAGSSQARPSSSGSHGRPSSAGGRSSSAGGRPSSAVGRPKSSAAGGRPGTPRGKANGTANGTAEPLDGRSYRRDRIEYRLALKQERKAEKARIKAQQPKVDADWLMRLKALWSMFYMSYYPRMVIGLGCVMFLIAIILIGITAGTEEDLKDADAIIAIFFIFGLAFIVTGALAYKFRRKEKEKRRRLGYDKKTGKYGDEIEIGGPVMVSSTTNVKIPTISEEVEPSGGGHINGMPLKEGTVLSSGKPNKPTFEAVNAEESGFTNLNSLAVMMDADQLPGTPYRQRRRESIESSLSSLNAAVISSSVKDDPDILVVPPPKEQLNTNQNNKSGDGRRVKKSKGVQDKSSLDDIPEITVRGATPSPRASPRRSPNHPIYKNPPIPVLNLPDSDQEDETLTITTTKNYYSNKGFDEGDITPDDLV